MLSFDQQLAAFVAATRAKANLIKRTVGLQVLTGVVNKTPVDTGRARGGWQVDNASPEIDQNGAMTISKGAFAINKTPFSANVIISNNVDYILFLEDGSSQQAPQGMVKRTLDEVGAQF